MKSLYRSKRYFICLVSCLLIVTSVNAESVLVGHPITVGISEALLADTDVEILNAVPKKLPASRQQHYLETRGKTPLISLSQKADAVITVKSISGKDYLYPLARRSNINIIPIDIAQPLDGNKSGVAKLDTLIDNEHPVWLNPNSLLTMMMVFSDEIKRLKQTSKKTAEIIDNNLKQQQQKLRIITTQMEQTIDILDKEPVALVLDPKLIYFIQGLHIQYHLTNSTKISDKELNTLIENNNISLVISSKKITKEQKSILSQRGVASLRIKRLKAKNPIDQLETNYADLKSILNFSQNKVRQIQY